MEGGDLGNDGTVVVGGLEALVTQEVPVGPHGVERKYVARTGALTNSRFVFACPDVPTVYKLAVNCAD